MGLDMYLNKRIYVGGHFEHRGVTGSIKIPVGYDGIETITIPGNKIGSIDMQVGYWRKSNQIHNWFVENLQDGNDDCEEYYVPGDALVKLKDICLQILKNKDVELAKELLPSVKGFFFGGTEYDHYYFSNLEDTVKIIDDIIKEDPDLIGNYYYSSSW